MDPLTAALLEFGAEKALAGLFFLAKRSIGEASPTRLAAARTAQVFPEVEGLTDSLDQWCRGDVFEELITKVTGGERGIDVRAWTNSLYEAGFDWQPDPEPKAEAVLASFVKNLTDVLLMTGAGLPILAATQDRHHAEEMGAIIAVRDNVVMTTQNQREILQLLQMIGSTQAPTDDRERVIDQAKTLAESGHPGAAQDLLRRLESEGTPPTGRDRVWFRLLTNLGACALGLGEVERGCSYFERALPFAPENPKALGNAALAALLRGDSETAIQLAEDARKIAPHDDHATSVLLQALLERGNEPPVQDLLQREDWIGEAPECGIRLAIHDLGRGRFARARISADAITIRHPSIPEAWTIKAQALMLEVQQRVSADPPIRWRIPSEIATLVDTAADAAERAVALSATSMHLDSRASALLIRSAVRSFRRDHRGAIADCDAVLVLKPTSSQAVQNKAFSLLELGSPEEAIRTLESLAPDEKNETTALVAARAHLERGQPERIPAILEPYCTPSVQSPPRPGVLTTLLAAYGRLGHREKAEGLLARLGDLTGEPEALELRVEHLMRTKATEEAVTLLRDALPRAVGRARDRLGVALAEALFASERYAEAAEAYEGLVDQKDPSPILEHYLASLFNAGAVDHALKGAQQVRAAGRSTPRILMIESLALEREYDFDGAERVLNELTAMEPADAEARLRLAMLLYRQGRLEDARATAGEVSKRSLADRPRTLMRTAHIRALLSMGGELDFAYRARRLGVDDPDVHLAYLGLVLGRLASDPVLAPHGEVQVGSAVSLSDGSESQTFILEEEDGHPPTGEDLRPDNPVWDRLLGRKVGDTVTVKDTDFETIRLTVTEIRPKHAYAVQQTLALFTKKWPDHPGLFRVPATGGDLSLMFAAVDRRDSAIRRFEELYRDRQFTLGAFGNAIGVSAVDIWNEMVARETGVIWTSSGDRRELAREQAHAGDSEAVVLDLTALLTVAHLDLREVLKAVFRRVLVPRAVVDAIAEQRLIAGSGPQSHGSLGKEGEQYVYTEVTEEMHKEREEFLVRLIAIGEAIGQLVPAPELLAADRLDEQGVLGTEAVAALGVARTPNTVLFSDDLLLRTIGRSARFGVRTTGVQALLRLAVDRGALTPDEYHAHVQRLVLSNYRYISINADDLLWALRAESWALSPRATRMLQCLEGPLCDEPSAVVVTVEFLRRLWLDAPSPWIRLLVLDHCLQRLVTGRYPFAVLTKLRMLLQQAMRLNPIHALQIDREIQRWIEYHGLGFRQ